MLHAVWNALAKRARDQLVFLWSSVSLATVVLLPVGLLALPGERIPAAAVPFVVATIAIHAVYFYALGRAYRHGDFSRVYPIARGLGVALVPMVALMVFGERLSPLGTAGIALVVAGVAGLHLTAPWRGGARPPASGAGTAWALLTGLLIASYSIVDKAGVARLHPLPYIGLMGLGMSALLVPVVLHDRAALAREWRENWQTIVVASAMNLTSYLLVLFAFRLSQVGYVVAARERLDRAGGRGLRRARVLINVGGSDAAPPRHPPPITRGGRAPRIGSAGAARARTQSVPIAA